MKYIEPYHVGDIRIGDLVGLMIFANYLRVIENEQNLLFNKHSIKQYIHDSLNVEVLFKNVIDVFVDIDRKDNNVDSIIRGSGCLWITIPQLLDKYGHQILPELNIDSKYYNGPDWSWGKHIVFSPLFSPRYNMPRQMNETFCNRLIDDLYNKYSDRLIVITNEPHKVINKKVTCYIDSDLYNIIYIISKSQIFIGGDTGFTHFAGLCLPKGIASIYQDWGFKTSYTMLPNATKFNFWNCRPSVDSSKTKHLQLTMQNNKLSSHSLIHELISLIDIEN